MILLGEIYCFSVQRSELQVRAPNDLVEIAAMDLDDELFLSRQKAQKLAQKDQCTATTTRGHRGTEGNNNGIIWRVVGLGLLTEMEIRRLMKG